jgi:hypothetical protein
MSGFRAEIALVQKKNHFMNVMRDMNLSGVKRRILTACRARR